jgi:hypothetical protein
MYVDDYEKAKVNAMLTIFGDFFEEKIAVPT